MDRATDQRARGLRLLAGLVDACVVIGAAAILALLVEPLASMGEPRPSVGTAVVQAVAVLAVVLLPVAVLVALEGRLGTSPGKALVGLKVRTVDGRRPGVRRSLARTTYRVSPVGLLGAGWALASGQGRPWHDEWAGTVVHPRHAPPSPTGPAVEAASTPSGATPRTDVRRSPGAAPPARAPAAPPTAPAAEVDTAALLDAVAPEPAPGPPASEPVDATPPAPAATPSAPLAPRSTAVPSGCRCREVQRLAGDAAVAYAGGHLRAVRRRPARGELVLVCPATRAVWLAREPWAAPDGITTLDRQGPVTGAPSPSPMAAPRR